MKIVIALGFGFASVAFGAFFAQAPDPLSGGAGWFGAGLLGCVLLWLCVIRLPANDKQVRDLVDLKDKQVRELLDRSNEEREKERTARHNMADQAQRLVMDVTLKFQQALQDTRLQHKDDAERDRAAFLERSSRLEEAIRSQTNELKLALVQTCRYRDSYPSETK